MLKSIYGTIEEQVKTTFDTLHKKVYEILKLEKNETSGADVFENEIFDILKDFDETYLQLLIEHAFEYYLHNQFSTDTKIPENMISFYIPSEDEFLRLTHYINSRIKFIKHKDLNEAYKNGRYQFSRLKTEMIALINVDKYIQSVLNKECQWHEECEYVFKYLDSLNPQLIEELYIYVISLIDQIGDKNIHVFTIGDKLDKEYGLGKLLEIMNIRDLIQEYRYSLYKKEKGNEEQEKQRTRSNDNELPFEI